MKCTIYYVIHKLNLTTRWAVRGRGQSFSSPVGASGKGMREAMTQLERATRQGLPTLP
jgi:hypothetical protein